MAMLVALILLNFSTHSILKLRTYNLRKGGQRPVLVGSRIYPTVASSCNRDQRSLTTLGCMHILNVGG